MVKRAEDCPWPERDVELRKWWAHRNPDGTGLKTGEIMERMRLSKGSVISRARRLGLPQRTAEGARLSTPPRLRHAPREVSPYVVANTDGTASVRVESMSSIVRVETTEDFGRGPHAPMAHRKPPTHVAPPPLPALPKYGRITECQAIEDDGGCPNRSRPGKPYCEEHCRRYYIGAPKSRLPSDAIA